MAFIFAVTLFKSIPKFLICSFGHIPLVLYYFRILIIVSRLALLLPSTALFPCTVNGASLVGATLDKCDLAVGLPAFPSPLLLQSST
jgi:hypothetical protein